MSAEDAVLAAASASLADGDIVTAVGGQPIVTGTDLQQAVLSRQPGDTLRLTVRRAGQTRDIDVVLRAFRLPSSAGNE